jgi:hypothetical protein
MRVAAIQTVTGITLDDNLARADALIAEAARGGAELVLLPEYFCMMGRHETDKVAIREQDGDGPMQSFLADAARAIASGWAARCRCGAATMRASTTRRWPSTRMAAAWRATTRSTCSASPRARELRRIAHDPGRQDAGGVRGAVRPGGDVGLLRPALSELYRGLGRDVS